MSFEWQGLPLDELVSEKRIRQAAVENLKFAEGIFRKRAPEIRQWMAQNATWDDRTTDARAGLLDSNHNGVVLRQPTSLFMILNYAPVEHRGYYYPGRLEFDFGGRFAIVGPALDTWAPRLFSEVGASRV